MLSVIVAAISAFSAAVAAVVAVLEYRNKKQKKSASTGTSSIRSYAWLRSLGLGFLVWVVLFGVGTAVAFGIPRIGHNGKNPSASATITPSGTTGSPTAASSVTPTSSTPAIVPRASITITDRHTSGISYLHDVPGQMTGFKPGEEAVWILVIIPGDPKLYPQGECNVTGETSFNCPKTQFGDRGGKGTYFARAVIVNAKQERILKARKESGLTSMPKVIAISDYKRYNKG